MGQVSNIKLGRGQFQSFIFIREPLRQLSERQHHDTAFLRFPQNNLIYSNQPFKKIRKATEKKFRFFLKMMQWMIRHL